MAEITLASFNLYQYAAPGTFWYEAEASNDYDPAQWDAKQDFVGTMLARLDADIIGFQEVFSVAAFRALVAPLGYDVRILSTPSTSADNPAVFTGPVVALASRLPVRAARVLPPDPAIEPEGLLASGFGYRRDIIEAEIEVPGLDLPLVVYVCHLKSQGAFVDADAIAVIDGWGARFQAHLRARALADANQVIRRAGEAMMLYAHIMDRIAARPGQPVAVIGDLNDEPDSFTLRILTQSDWLRTIARRAYSALEPAQRAQRYGWLLYSAAQLAPMQSPGAPIPTHASWRGGSVLDYILVSNALNQNNPRGLAEVVAYDVLNDHHGGAMDRLTTSDHAPIRAALRLR